MAKIGQEPILQLARSSWQKFYLILRSAWESGANAMKKLKLKGAAALTEAVATAGSANAI